MAVSVKIDIFWDVVLYSLVEVIVSEHVAVAIIGLVE
jgi:hypothetical protein